ncbi:hypothetical protein ABMA58_13510, partial [Oceanospirillum sp. HFRX-1_2]
AFNRPLRSSERISDVPAGLKISSNKNRSNKRYRQKNSGHFIQTKLPAIFIRQNRHQPFSKA